MDDGAITSLSRNKHPQLSTSLTTALDSPQLVAGNSPCDTMVVDRPSIPSRDNGDVLPDGDVARVVQSDRNIQLWLRAAAQDGALLSSRRAALAAANALIIKVKDSASWLPISSSQCHPNVLELALKGSGVLCKATSALARLRAFLVSRDIGLGLLQTSFGELMQTTANLRAQMTGAHLVAESGRNPKRKQFRLLFHALSKTGR